MNDTLSGRYYPPGSSAAEPATLRASGGLAIITLEESGKAKPFEIINMSDRLANIARKITLKGGGVFETADNEGVDRAFNQGGAFAGRLTKVESSLKYVAVLALLTVAALVGMYRYGLPALASGAANFTPSSVVSLMDAGTLSTVDKVLFNASNLDKARKREISGLFDELVMQAGQNEPALKLLFRDGGRLGANAIALPGGTIIITDQLIAAAKSDDEIAGVLGHEIGHVELRHSLKQIYRVLGIGFMVTIIGGDSGQLVEDVIAQAAVLESLSYTRKFETESDYRSAELMVGIGRDPFAFVELLKRLTNDDGKKKENGYNPSRHL